MRVLLISSNFPLSPEDASHSFVFDYAKKVAELGNEVRVVREADAPGEFIAERGSGWLKHATRVIERLRYVPKNPRYPVKVYRTVRYAARISQVVDDWEPHVVHAFFAYPEGAAAAVALVPEGKIPLVTSVLGHDIDVESSIGYGLRLHPYLAELIAYALRKSDRVIAGSKCLLDESRRILRNGRKVLEIPPGVDCKRFRPRPGAVAVRKKFHLGRLRTVLTIRQLSPEYGITHLINAFSSTTKHVMSKLIIGGDGPSRVEAQELAKRLGVHEEVVFAGPVRRSQVPDLIASCDVYCDPCLLGQGVSTLEAMSTGKPVVGFNAYTTKIVHGRTGLLVSPDDARGLTSALTRLLRDTGTSKKMGEAGRRMVQKYYDLDRNTKRLLKIYARARRG